MPRCGGKHSQPAFSTLNSQTAFSMVANQEPSRRSPPLVACSTAGPSSARHQTGRMRRHPACGAQRCMAGRAAVATIALGRLDMLGRQDVAQQEGSTQDAPESTLHLLALPSCSL